MRLDNDWLRPLCRFLPLHVKLGELVLAYNSISPFSITNLTKISRGLALRASDIFVYKFVKKMQENHGKLIKKIKKKTGKPAFGLLLVFLSSFSLFYLNFP